MASWTSKMGFPCLLIREEKWNGQHLDLTIEQRWFLADGTGCAEEALWNIPIVEATRLPASSPSVPYFAKTRLFQKSIDLGSPDGFVKLNTNQSALARVSHTAEMISRLGIVVRSKELNAVDRAYLLDDQFALAVAGLAPIELTASLLPAYAQEDSSAVWKTLQTVFLGLKHGNSRAKQS